MPKKKTHGKGVVGSNHARLAAKIISGKTPTRNYLLKILISQERTRAVLETEHAMQFALKKSTTLGKDGTIFVASVFLQTECGVELIFEHQLPLEVWSSVYVLSCACNPLCYAACFNKSPTIKTYGTLSMPSAMLEIGFTIRFLTEEKKSCWTSCSSNDRVVVGT